MQYIKTHCRKPQLFITVLFLVHFIYHNLQLLKREPIVYPNNIKKMRSIDFLNRCIRRFIYSDALYPVSYLLQVLYSCCIKTLDRAVKVSCCFLHSFDITYKKMETTNSSISFNLVGREKWSVIKS